MATGVTLPAAAPALAAPALARLPGWEARLDVVVEAARHAPYALGRHDCARFAGTCVAAVTGVDLWPQVGAYASRREAAQAIAAFGRDLAAAVSRLLGVDLVAPVLARRGDVVLYRDVEDHLGVCLGAQVAVLGPDGMAFVPITSPDVVGCWRVG